jgi:3-oxoacyl-[acyl-carrier protein] reductase
MDLNLKGRVVVVTGANRGIGRAIAQTVTEEGATAVVLARDEAASAATVAALGADRACAIRCDITRPDDIKAAVAEIERRFGRLDAVVNNAGRLTGGPVAEISPGALREGFDTKVVASVELIQAALPLLRKSNQARIVNISGVSTQRVMPNAAITAVANAGVVTLSAYLARELAKDGITSNCVIPGYTLTGPWQGRAKALAEAEGMSVEAAEQAILTRQDMGHSRWGTEAEIAEVVVFLLSRQARFMNGTAFRIDGGQFVAIQG